MNRASFNGNKLLACRLLIFWLIQSAYFSSLFIYPLLEGVAAAHGHRPAVADAAQPHRRRHLPPVQRFHHRVRFLRPLGQALGLQRLLTVDQGFFSEWRVLLAFVSQVRHRRHLGCGPQTVAHHEGVRKNDPNRLWPSLTTSILESRKTFTGFSWQPNSVDRVFFVSSVLPTDDRLSPAIARICKSAHFPRSTYFQVYSRSAFVSVIHLTAIPSATQRTCSCTTGCLVTLKRLSFSPPCCVIHMAVLVFDPLFAFVQFLFLTK